MIRFLRYAVIAAVVVYYTVCITGCAQPDPSRVSSVALPGNPVLSFPNNADRTGSTLLLSSPASAVAGIDGRILTISAVTLNKPQDELTVDTYGNMGLHGSYHSLSSRSAKKQVEPLRVDALALIDHTKVVTFRLRTEPNSMGRHIGIIADDAPEELTGDHHRSFDLNNSLAVNLAATSELHSEVRRLEQQVEELERRLSHC